MGNVAEEQLVGLADVTASLFEPYLGQTMVFERLVDADGTVSEPAHMTLLEVRRGIKSPAMRREPFSLLFAMKDQSPLGSGLHRLVHLGCEPADLLVSRVNVPKYQAIDPTRMYYEVVFG